jgi:MtN3 and saliva related transmembrane protein
MSETGVTIIGFAAATLTTASFVPQVIQTIRTKRTKDISLGMYTAVTLGVFLWLVYGLFLNNPPIYIANGITLSLASIILYLKIKHG